MSQCYSVLVVGAGPVGMCAAIQAARQGIDVVVVESRAEGAVADAKCNSVASRTLETLRRFGIAEEVRAAGLPDDYPTDIIYATSIAGPEMTRIPMPSRKERQPNPLPAGFADEGWRTAEPYVRVSQRYSNMVLAKLMHATPGITVLYNTEVVSHQQTAEEVIVQVRRPDSKLATLRAKYVIAADGGRSPIRHQLDIKLSGDAELGHLRSSLIRAPGLLALFEKRRPAWMSWVVNHKVRGVVVAIDGKEQWLVHRQLPAGTRDFAALHLDQSIRDVLGVEADFKFEVLNHEDWIGRRLVADRMRDRRVFLAGDAAHLWVPFAGYGMNAGIADGVSIAWLLGNVLQGWADPAMLDAYEAERHPITEQVSRHAMQSMLDTIEALGRNTPPASLSSRFNPAGVALRAVMGAKLNKLNIPQFAPEGLNFGYFYDHSPLICYDNKDAPGYTMGSVTHSTVPGCRLPHFWLAPGISIYDKLGPAYTLLRFDPALDLTSLVAAAVAAKMPLTVLDLPPRPTDAPYQHSLLLVREDQHIAWRGHQLPTDVTALINRLCGRAAVGAVI